MHDLFPPYVPNYPYLFTLMIFGTTKEAASYVNSFILSPMANPSCQCLLQKLSYHLTQFLFNSIKIRTTISVFRRKKYENFLLLTPYPSLCSQIKVPESPDPCRQNLVLPVAMVRGWSPAFFRGEREWTPAHSFGINGGGSEYGTRFLRVL